MSLLEITFSHSMVDAGPRSEDKIVGDRSFYLVTAQRFILGLTDISTMPSFRSINLPWQNLALV